MSLPVSQAIAEASQLVRHGLPYRIIPNFIPDDAGLVCDDEDAYVGQLPEENPGRTIIDRSLRELRSYAVPEGDFLLFVGDLVYDKGVDITNREGVYELLVNYRSGDMWAPQLEQIEALRHELSYFVDCISSGQEPFNDGCAGLRVVRMLEAASESLSKRGALVYL